jgi:hypothetical protein
MWDYDMFLCYYAEVDVGFKADSMMGRIEGLSLDGEFDNDSDGTQTGVLPILDLGDMDSPKQVRYSSKSGQRFKRILSFSLSN